MKTLTFDHRNKITLYKGKGLFSTNGLLYEGIQIKAADLGYTHIKHINTLVSVKGKTVINLTEILNSLTDGNDNNYVITSCHAGYATKSYYCLFRGIRITKSYEKALHAIVQAMHFDNIRFTNKGKAVLKGELL